MRLFAGVQAPAHNVQVKRCAFRLAGDQELRCASANRHRLTGGHNVPIKPLVEDTMRCTFEEEQNPWERRGRHERVGPQETNGPPAARSAPGSAHMLRTRRRTALTATEAVTGIAQFGDEILLSARVRERAAR